MRSRRLSTTANWPKAAPDGALAESLADGSAAELRRVSTAAAQLTRDLHDADVALAEALLAADSVYADALLAAQQAWSTASLNAYHAYADAALAADQAYGDAIGTALDQLVQAWDDAVRERFTAESTAWQTNNVNAAQSELDLAIAAAAIDNSPQAQYVVVEAQAWLAYVTAATQAEITAQSAILEAAITEVRAGATAFSTAIAAEHDAYATWSDAVVEAEDAFAAGVDDALETVTDADQAAAETLTDASIEAADEWTDAAAEAAEEQGETIADAVTDYTDAAVTAATDYNESAADAAQTWADSESAANRTARSAIAAAQRTLGTRLASASAQNQRAKAAIRTTLAHATAAAGVTYAQQQGAASRAFTGTAARSWANDAAIPMAEARATQLHGRTVAHGNRGVAGVASAAHHGVRTGEIQRDGILAQGAELLSAVAALTIDTIIWGGAVAYWLGIIPQPPSAYICDAWNALPSWVQTLAKVGAGVVLWALVPCWVPAGAIWAGIAVIRGITLINSVYDRASDNQAWWQVVLGSVSDAIGVSALFAFAAGRDLVTWNDLHLTTEQRVNIAIELVGTLLGAKIGAKFRACFAAGTPIRTPDGAKPIEQIVVGDRVLTRDETDPDAAVVARRVEEVFVRTSAVLALSVGGQTIRTTHEHPFWVRGQGWTNAQELRPGYEIAGEYAGWLKVEAVEDTGEVTTVYNFSVADHHTYFVGAIEWGWAAWAHNAAYTRTGIARKNPADWRGLRDSWDSLGYGQILSAANRALIARGRVPRVDQRWIAVFPGDAALLGQRISMHHIGGSQFTIPLPWSRHLDAHFPGGFRFNLGGPGMPG